MNSFYPAIEIGSSHVAPRSGDLQGDPVALRAMHAKRKWRNKWQER